MDKERVQMMLALARRKREGGLDEKELKELDALRQEYLKDFRAGFQQQLDMVRVEQEDGSYLPLQKKTEPPKPEGDA